MASDNEGDDVCWDNENPEKTEPYFTGEQQHPEETGLAF